MPSVLTKTDPHHEYCVYLDTSVILRVAYEEGATEALKNLVRTGTANRGRIVVIVVAPVLSELMYKVDAEERYAQRHSKDLKDLVSRIRNEVKGDRDSRPTKIGLPELLSTASALEGYATVLESSSDKRRQRIRDVVEALQAHAQGSNLEVTDLQWAFEEETRLMRERPGDMRRPGRADLLVLGAVRAAHRKRPGVFLTMDRSLRGLAKEHGLLIDDPDEFSEKPPDET